MNWICRLAIPPSSSPVPWAEVWLLPADPGYHGRAIVLILMTPGALQDESLPPRAVEWLRQVLSCHGLGPPIIEGRYMLKPAGPLSRQDVVDCAARWLKASGLEAVELLEVPGTCFQSIDQGSDRTAAPGGLAESGPEPG